VVVEVATKPGELFSGVLVGVKLDLLHSLIQGAVAIEISEQLLIANSVQRIEPTMGQQPSGFIQQPLRHHLLHPLVDTLVESLSVHIQAKFDDVERTFLGRLSTKTRIRLSGEQAELKAVQNPLGIVAVNRGCVCGVQVLQFSQQGLQAFLLPSILQLLTQYRINVRHVVNALTDGINVEHGTTRHQNGVVQGKQGCFQQSQDLRFKAGGTVIIVNAEVPNEMVGHSIQLGLRRSGRADAHVAVKLPGITGYDGAAQPFGQIQAEACLAYACRTGQDNQGLHPALKIRFCGPVCQFVEAGKAIGIQLVHVKVLVSV
jgi:hypothetical protein